VPPHVLVLNTRTGARGTSPITRLRPHVLEIPPDQHSSTPRSRRLHRRVDRSLRVSLLDCPPLPSSTARMSSSRSPSSLAAATITTFPALLRSTRWTRSAPLLLLGADHGRSLGLRVIADPAPIGPMVISRASSTLSDDAKVWRWLYEVGSDIRRRRYPRRTWREGRAITAPSCSRPRPNQMRRCSKVLRWRGTAHR